MGLGVALFIAAVVAYFLATTLLRRYYELKVQGFYATGLFDECFDTLNKFFPRILMSTYDQYLWRYMVHEARGERELATRMIELIVRMRGSKKRRANSLAMAFNYFVSIKDKKRARELLAEMKGLCDGSVIKDATLTYDIMFGGCHDYIDRMEAMLDSATPEMRAKLYMLLAKQCRNAGDRKRAKYYDGLLKQLMEENSAPTQTRGMASGVGARDGVANGSPQGTASATGAPEDMK